MDLGLRARTAIVVGGGNGIGRAIGEAFAAEGARVVLLDRDPSVLETAVTLAAAHGVSAWGWTVDVTAAEQVQASVARIRDQCGDYHHVVYAAGVGSGKFGFPFWNLTPTDWPRVLEVNLLGMVHVAHAFAPPLVEARGGSFLFLASVAGQIGSQTDPPYSAAKAAQINFMQCMAKDLAPFGVRVNCICPGMVRTNLNRAVWQAWHDQQPLEQRLSYDEWTERKIRQVVPLGRWQDPEDIAALGVFLASSRAKNITGQTMNVDGGFVMHW